MVAGVRRRFAGLRPIHRIAVVAAVFVLAGLGSAAVYAARQDRICTLMGTLEGVHVALGPERSDVRSIRICADDRCRTLRPGALPLGTASVVWEPGGPDRLDARVTVDRYGRGVERATGAVELRPAAINGKGCGVTWSANAELRGGRIVQVD